MVYQFGMLFAGTPDPVGLTAAVVVAAFMVFMLVKPQKDEPKLKRANAKI